MDVDAGEHLELALGPLAAFERKDVVRVGIEAVQIDGGDLHDDRARPVRRVAIALPVLEVDEAADERVRIVERTAHALGENGVGPAVGCREDLPDGNIVRPRELEQLLAVHVPGIFTFHRPFLPDSERAQCDEIERIALKGAELPGPHGVVDCFERRR